MLSSATHDAAGFLITEPTNDRCAYYVPIENRLNLNRCVCCVFYDANAMRCVNEKNRKENRDPMRL